MKLPVSTLTERLRVGLIQTSLDYEIAWATSPKMSKVEEDHAVSEIGRFVAGFREEKPGPDIVVMPELAVPHGFLPRLRVMARTLSAVIIAGLDYRDRSTATERIVSNEAVVIVPNRWRKRQISSHTSVRYIGKTYCSHGEQQRLDQQKYGFSGDNAIWVFDGDDAGRFGIVICYDFLDLERVASYRGQIQHLFVLAYNKDIRSFQHAAEAMARMVFCNVLVCNAGYYGGSLVCLTLPQARAAHDLPAFGVSIGHGADDNHSCKSFASTSAK